MDTLDRSPVSTERAEGIERIGYALVAIGYVVMTLGILEIGGLFNVVCGLLLAWAGGLVMFGGEIRRRSDEEAEFRRAIGDL
jgi:hypothetical protein